MKKTFLILIAASAAALLCSCGEEKNKNLITFHIGSTLSMEPGIMREGVTMPMSGMHLMAQKEPFMYSGDIDRVDVAEVTMPGGAKVRGFYFKCQNRGSRRLLQATGSHWGDFIVVKYNEHPIAIRKIDSTITNGMLFACSEIPDAECQAFVDDMNESIKNVNEIKEEAHELY